MIRARNVVVFAMVFSIAMLWAIVTAKLPNGVSDMFGFVVLAAIIAVAATTVLFGFSGVRFTWRRAIITSICATAILAPALASYFTVSNDATLSTRLLLFIAILWIASLGGTLWKLAASAGDAFREWQTSRT